MKEEVAEREEGVIPLFYFKKSTEEYGIFQAVAGIVSLANGLWI
jgi:hypothetical protein